MNALAKVFDYQTQQVRILLVDGSPWFVVADVCRILDLSNPTMAASRLDPDDLSTAEVIDGMGRTQQARIVNESGLYDLIFMSRKPEAKAFKRWVTHDLLPTLRKTGRYEVEPVARPLPASYAEALRELAAQVEETEKVQAELAVAAPKAAHWDTLASADGDWSVADAAKVLSRDPAIKLGQGRLFTVLKDMGWIYRQRGDGRWRVYQDQITTGRMSEIPASHYHPRTGELVIDPPQVRVTTKGLAALHAKLGGASALALTP